MAKFPSRPKDFYGPEDYYDNMDIEEEERRIAKRQAKWDAEYKALPWWKREMFS